MNSLPEPQGSSKEICEPTPATLDAGGGYASYLWSNGPTDRTITVKATDTCTVTVTNLKGCSTDAYHTLNVNPLPHADIAMAGEVCASSAGNSAITPDAGVGATYEWSITNGTIDSAAPYGASIGFTAGDDATPR